jgi:hypothetical protein
MNSNLGMINPLSVSIICKASLSISIKSIWLNLSRVDLFFIRKCLSDLQLYKKNCNERTIFNLWIIQTNPI